MLVLRPFVLNLCLDQQPLNIQVHLEEDNSWSLPVLLVSAWVLSTFPCFLPHSRNMRVFIEDHRSLSENRNPRGRVDNRRLWPVALHSVRVLQANPSSLHTAIFMSPHFPGIAGKIGWWVITCVTPPGHSSFHKGFTRHILSMLPTMECSCLVLTCFVVF